MGVDDDLYDLIAIELGEPPRMLLQAREAAAADAIEWMNRRMAALNLPEDADVEDVAQALWAAQHECLRTRGWQPPMLVEMLRRTTRDFQVLDEPAFIDASDFQDVADGVEAAWRRLVDPAEQPAEALRQLGDTPARLQRAATRRLRKQQRQAERRAAASGQPRCVHQPRRHHNPRPKPRDFVKVRWW
jgi:hypothetical protein